jgi:dihydroflavonol-4-reductase
MSHSKVLVTGANGFLGAHLCRRLLDEGHSVSALVRKNSDLSEIEGLPVNKIFGDVTEPESLESAFRNQDTVFHLAGYVGYKKSDRPLMDRVNITGTKNVVDACLKLHTPNLLHLSSVVAVGASFEPAEMTEKSEYNLNHLNLGYYETKHLAEKIVLNAVANKNLNAVCVNPSTIYGAADAKKGSRKTQVKVARGAFPFYTSGGVNVVAVEDVLDGIIAAVEKGKIGERYLLTGDNILIKSLFEQIASFAGVPAPKILIPNWLLHTIGKFGDQFGVGPSQENAWSATLFNWFDSTKARTELNFKPRPSGVAIENSVRWMKDNGLLN